MSGRSKAVLAAVVIAAGVAYASTLRAGQDWGGDFAMYIMHARNIASGVPYGRTGYIVNPALASLGPETYPPVYPLLLAPIYRLFGLDFTAMKLEIVFLFVLFLVVLCAAFGRDRPTGITAGLVALVAANPIFWEFKDHVMSDIPFLLFAYAALATIDSKDGSETVARRGIPRGMAAGLLTYLAFGARQVGLIIVPCLFLLDLIRRRRVSPLTFGVMLVFVPLAAVQMSLMHTDAAYASQISFAPATVIENLVMHLRYLSLVFDNGYAQTPRLILFLIFTCLAAIGYATRLRERLSVWEIFAPMYLLALLVWTGRAQRYLLPLIPLLLLYALEGLRRLLAGRPPVLRRAVVALVATVFIGTYAARYSTMDLTEFSDGIASHETRELFDFISSSTDPDAVFVFRKPRVLTLFTDRSASVYHDAASDEAMWDYLDRIHAGYLIGTPDDTPWWSGFLERQGARLTRVFRNRNFVVYSTAGHRARSTASHVRVEARLDRLAQQMAHHDVDLLDARGIGRLNDERMIAQSPRAAAVPAQQPHGEKPACPGGGQRLDDAG